jgi:flagellar protein FliJ
MKKFTFRLETLLKVRRIEMEFQARALALAHREVQRARNELSDLKKLQADEVQRVKVLSEQGQFTKQLLDLSVAYRDELKRKEAKKIQELQALMLKAEEERVKLVEKEKKKKVLDKLKERDLENYNEEQKQSERKEMDELASTRWWAPDR